MTYTMWAKSEQEAAEMQALGWKPNDSFLHNHSHYALLLVWEGEGGPPMREEQAA